MELRRQFDLLPDDRVFLDEYGLPWETLRDGSLWVLIHDLSTHVGYNHVRVTAAIRLETGYPQTALNMVYFFPHLLRKDGQPIRATDNTQNLDGKDFQRWSRHYTTENPWIAGVHNLGTHVIVVEDWLAREFEKCPNQFR